MIKKYFWIVFFVIFFLVLAVTVFLRTEKVVAPIVENGDEKKPVEIATSDGVDAVWKIEELGEDQDLAPLSFLELEVKGKIYDLGNFRGNCFVIEESEWELLENELSGVICWWAGGGEEVGLFEKNGALEIWKGKLEEGGEDGGTFRGDFLKVFQVEN